MAGRGCFPGHAVLMCCNLWLPSQGHHGDRRLYGTGMQRYAAPHGMDTLPPCIMVPCASSYRFGALRIQIATSSSLYPAALPDLVVPWRSTPMGCSTPWISGRSESSSSRCCEASYHTPRHRFRSTSTPASTWRPRSCTPQGLPCLFPELDLLLGLMAPE